MIVQRVNPAGARVALALAELRVIGLDGAEEHVRQTRGTPETTLRRTPSTCMEVDGMLP